MSKAALLLLTLAGAALARHHEVQTELLQLEDQSGQASSPAPHLSSAVHVITVTQLRTEVEVAKNKNDNDAAEIIENLELAERLSSEQLSRLSSELAGPRAKDALIAIADASEFGELPSSEILDQPAPDIAEQREILSRASDYLKTIIPKLPDFYAKRMTTAYKVMWTPKETGDIHRPGALKLTGRTKATVLYRNGNEVVNTEGAAQEGLKLTIQGTFGPILATVMKDNLRSPMLWHGWEKRPDGAVAVFRFQVSKKDSQYSVSLPMAGLGATRVGYSGEIGIEPKSGTILRLVLQSDPALAAHALEHADIMVEYGPVVIGGKTYICPVREVSVSRARYQEIGIARRERAFILLNDVVFADYHVFRSEMRVLPR